MAGHSKWANIKHTKARVDAKRGKVFTKLIRLLMVAARAGGADPDSNPALRAALDKAKSANMTKDTIERAIKRGSGDSGDEIMETIRYEGYGTAGVAVMVECLTDNRNRTVAEVRHAFTKMGGNLGTDGSVAYLFSKQGQFVFPASCNEKQLFEIALESGAEDVETLQEGNFLVTSGEGDFFEIKENLEKANFIPEYAEINMKASMEVDLDAEQSEKLDKLIEMLEDLDDVQAVHTIANFSQ